MSTKRMSLVLGLLVVVAFILGACAQAAPTEAPMATEAPTAPPPPPPPTETPVPLGSPENPIIMGFVPSGTSQEILTGGEQLAQLLTQETGYTITPFQSTSYSALIEAMGSGNAQIGWLATFSYVVAKEKGFADVGLVTIRNGSDHYGFEIIAHKDAGYVPDADPAKALAQFDGKKPCWVDPLSSSGYVIPQGFFTQYGVNILSGRAAAFVGGHPAAVRAVYAKGICDFAAVFQDARTSSAIMADLPDVLDKVDVIYKSEPMIPNDTVSFAPDLPADARQKIVDALLKIAGTEEGKAALKTVYQIDGLVAHDDTFYDEFRVYLEASGVDVTTLFK